MEKYGFVYIWYDKKKNKFYVGSHWGTENDGYICSSTWMRNTYKRRSSDFKRRILKKVFSSRKDLLQEEQKFLNMIKDEEFGKKYYNLNKSVKDPWFIYPEKVKTVSEKISIRTKEAMARTDVREKYLRGLETRDTKASDPEVRKKRSETMISRGRNKGKITVKDSLGNIFHTTKEDPRWISGELIAASKGVKRPSLTEEHKEKIKKAGIFSNINNKKVSCIHCGFVGNPGNIGRYHNDKCKRKS